MRRRVARSPSDAPRTQPSPPVGLANPSRSFTAVVLPAPFGPRKPKTSPCGTVMGRPSSAITERYRLVSAAVWIAAEGGSGASRTTPRSGESMQGHCHVEDLAFGQWTTYAVDDTVLLPHHGPTRPCRIADCHSLHSIHRH